MQPTIILLISIHNSTGTDPAGWREFWRLESARVGTNWISLLDAAEAALSRLRTAHVSS